MHFNKTYLFITLISLFVSSLTFAAQEKPPVTIHEETEIQQGYSSKPKYSLRSSYRKLSVAQVQEMPNISISIKKVWGFNGHSTISHNYEPKTINDDSVVIDNATGLMWHQSGSSNYVKWNEAKQWVKDLNNRSYAGFSDWRLPTVEEAASLLEPGKRNGDLYITPVFDNKQRFIWTGDYEGGSGAAWSVIFINGGVSWIDVFDGYVRPVRSGK